MNKIFMGICVMLASFMMFSSCGLVEEVELTVDLECEDVPSGKGQIFVIVKSNSSWTISLADEATGAEPDWASLSSTSGAGDKNLLLSYDANPDKTLSRKLVVTAVSEPVTASASMVQSPAGPSQDPEPEDPTPDPEPDPTPDPEPEPEPDPDPDPTPTPEPGKSGKYAWYELPAMNLKSSGNYLVDAGDSDLYYAYHMCAGNEKGPGGKKARNYTVCYSAEHHCPVWVAAPRHDMYESGAKRTDAYAKDPDIPSNIQYNSKSTGGGCNKGHMLGSAERLSSTATNKQVFYYTNIAPQYSDTFNTGGGGWNTLEDWVDNQVCSDTLYVVIGTYFEKYTDRRGYTDSPKTISFGGRSDVTRPSMFYYVLMRTKKGNSRKPLSQCDASEIKCAAFVRSHATPKGVKVSEKDMMSVSDLEELTGFTYFPNVPQAPKDSYKASDWGL